MHGFVVDTHIGWKRQHYCHQNRSVFQLCGINSHLFKRITKFIITFCENGSFCFLKKGSFKNFKEILNEQNYRASCGCVQFKFYMPMFQYNLTVSSSQMQNFPFSARNVMLEN